MYRLTQFSHGAGCGCKLSPAALKSLLTLKNSFRQENLIVGYEASDDAAALALNPDFLLLATTDFFTPIVDDPKLFGKIAATNALSDIYAMGGYPILALGILGWPIKDLPLDLARQVLEGAREVLEKLGLQLAGGHSIDCREPIFGLSVNGLVHPKNLKRNFSAQEGDLLYLTKPIGTGILTTAEKKGVLQKVHQEMAIQSMTTLNSLGEKFAQIAEVHAMTDVTGFGLGGHLLEILSNSQKSARLFFGSLPLLSGIELYLSQNTIPGGTERNWQSYGSQISFSETVENTEKVKLILADPQTSGGLLLAVAPEAQKQIEELILGSPFPICAKPIGQVISGKGEIYVE